MDPREESDAPAPSGRLEAVLAVLNGLVGDYLARRKNGLSIDMTYVSGGEPLPLARLPLACPGPARKVVVLVHGLMCNEGAWAMPDGGDYGALLARDLGFTPLYVRYNSGRAIADNGAELSRLLDATLEAYPRAVEELLLVGFSMGGLVIRSATHAATVSGTPWPARVRRAIYLGTPHSGAPLERAARVAAGVLRSIDDPYARLVAELADVRSSGVKDLGDADLRHEDRAKPRPWLALDDAAHPVPLLPSIRHYLVAGALSPSPALALLFGDGIVPLASGAARGAALPPERVRVIPGAGHLSLARSPEVYAQIRAWCEEAA